MIKVSMPSEILLMEGFWSAGIDRLGLHQDLIDRSIQGFFA